MLLEIEGCDHKMASPLKTGWSLIGNGSGFTTGRFGGSCCITNSGAAGNNGFAFNLSTPNTGTTIVGVAIKASVYTTTSKFITFTDGTNNHIYLNLLNGAIQVYRGDGTGLGTSTTAPFLTTNTWRYVEVKTTIADSGGTCVIKVDGATVFSYTGDTRNAGTAQVATIMFLGDSSIYFDDIYIADATGSAPYNDFLGDVKVETLVPTADGTYSQLVGSDGNSVSNWQQVDEQPPVSTDYNGSATVGQRDTYNMSNLVTTSGTVYAVKALIFAHKSDAGAANMKPIVRLSGGTERIETSQPLAGSMAPIITDLRTTDPANAAWTISSVNGIELGAEVS